MCVGAVPTEFFAPNSLHPTDAAMGFSIYYRTTETMQPVLAYEIKQQAARLVGAYRWNSCEPVTLTQQTSGYLFGASKPNFFPPEVDSEPDDVDNMPDGTVLSLVEILNSLAREYDVVWNIGHDYEPEPIGQVNGKNVDVELLEELETLGSIGDLLEDAFEVDGEESIADLTDEFDNTRVDRARVADKEDEMFGDDLHQKKLAQWTSAEFGDEAPAASTDDEESDDEGPHVIKFPGI